MFLPIGFRSVVLVLVVCCSVLVPRVAPAQTAQARRDSLLELRRTVEQFKSRIQFADSAGDPGEACRQRIMLAPLVKRSEAVELYETAAHIADTARLFEGEELRAREELMELYRATGSWRQAFDQAGLVAALKDDERARDSSALHGEVRSLRAIATAQQDSLQGLLDKERGVSKEGLAGAEARADRWQLIAILSGALWMFALAYVLGRIRRTEKRTRAELTALRTEVATLKAPQNRFREPAAPVVVPPPPVAPPSLEPPVPLPEVASMDESLLALFRKRAPERLATLRDARARGDHEKVARVLHTLKPQLLALDEHGAGAVCLRLIAEGAQEDAQRWQQDLDQLERSMEHLLG